MMSNVKNLILDMDGVLWHGETAVPGLAAFFAALARLEMGYVLATNNATKSAADYSGKLARFGLQIPAERILTSAEATAGYLSTTYSNGAKVYVVGESGLRQEVAGKGFHILSTDEAHAGATAAVVVVGYNRGVTYKELAMGALLVHKGADFVGTNPDPSFPSEIGPLPGAGALLAFIQVATGVAPTVIGKPGPLLFQQAVQRLGGTVKDTAMVGDRLTTDIAGGKAAGLSTILLLSGISKREDIESSGIRPDLVFDDLAALTANLPSIRTSLA
jgi:4-nitrophenyl phosphatase